MFIKSALNSLTAALDQLKVIASFFRHPGSLTLGPEHKSARMSKITNDGLTRSGTGRFIAVPWQQCWCQMVKAVPDTYFTIPACTQTDCGWFLLFEKPTA